MAGGLFARPSSIRPALQSQSSARVAKEVFSEDDLIAAIAEIASRFDGTVLSAFGGAICIGAPITIREPITIPYQCPGLTIFSLSKVPIVAGEAAQDACFIVNAALVTLRGLFVYGTADRYFTTFARAVTPSTAGFSPQNLTIAECNLWVDRIYQDATDNGATDARIIDNWQNEATNSALSTILFDSERCTARGNRIEDSGTNAIEVTANGGYCSIDHNFCGGADIVTSASGGYNTVDANVQCGALTVHTTDALGLNT